MRNLMVFMTVVVVCLCGNAAGDGNDLKSLVRPQTFSYELRDVRLTRAIDEMSSDTETKIRESDTATTKHIQSDNSKRTVGSSSSDVTISHKEYDVRIGGRISAEGKWGPVPSGSIGGSMYLEGSAGMRGTNDRTRSKKSETEVSVADVVNVSSSEGYEKEVNGSDKSRLGGYRLKFSVVLKNRDVNDELQVDASRMLAKLRGPDLTGVISVHCCEKGEFVLGADDSSFEFVYPIDDERMLAELIHLAKGGQLGQLFLSETAGFPVMSKKTGKNVLSEQSTVERRNPSTAVLIEFGEFKDLPFWRVSRRHTAKSGRRGTFVTLREALQGIGLWVLDFSDTLPEQIIGFSKDGALAKVLDATVVKKGDDGCYQALALRLKDNKGKTSLGLPLADRLALNIADYSEIAIISFTFDEFAEKAVQFSGHVADFKTEIESWLARVDDNVALPAFRKAISLATVKRGLRYLEGKDVTKNEEEAVDLFRKAAEQGDAEGQFQLGKCYEYGIGVEEDEKEAVNWYCKAAKQDHIDAQICLGLCYKGGIGVVTNEKKAVEFFLEVAKQGNAVGQFQLGMCYGAPSKV